MVRQKEDAEDLVQITAGKALKAANVPQCAVEYRKWLFRVLRNVFIDKYRKNQLSRSINYDADCERLASPESSLSDVLTVRCALDSIKDEYKEIIYLVDIAGFSYSETSDIMKIPMGTVMSRLSRARRALLAVLSKKEISYLCVNK